MLSQTCEGPFFFPYAEVGRRKPQRRVRVRGVCLTSFLETISPQRDHLRRAALRILH
jgi:hypothetical protein